MVRILTASDIHETEYEDSEETRSFPKLRHICDIANYRGVDGIFLNGDYVGNQKVGSPELIPVMRVNNESTERFKRWVDYENREVLEIYSEVLQLGGINSVRRAINEGALPSKLVEALKTLLKDAERVESKFEDVEREYAPIIDFNERWTKADIDDLKKKLKEKAFSNYREMDRALGSAKCPVYAVRGNWETDFFYEYPWKNLKILEKQGVVDVKGVKFAGAPNFHEYISHLGSSFYEKAEKDPVQPDLENIQNNPVINRLFDKDFDVLMTHKGLHQLAEEGGNDLGSGFGLGLVVKQKRPSVIVGGHVHNSKTLYQPVTEDYGYQGIRTSDEEFFEMDISPETKKVVQMQKYKWSDDVKYKAA